MRKSIKSSVKKSPALAGQKIRVILLHHSFVTIGVICGQKAAALAVQKSVLLGEIRVIFGQKKPCFSGAKNPCNFSHHPFVRIGVICGQKAAALTVQKSVFISVFKK